MGKVKKKYYTKNSFMHPQLKRNISFLHAFSGCDTMAALCDKRKKKVLDIFVKYPDLQDKADSFYNRRVKHLRLTSAGQHIMKAV